jgi:glycosyltransferase involved in cell wall biosynthesis
MYSSAIVNVSEANRTLALRHGISTPERQVTIWNGIPDSPHRAKPGESGTPSIIMVGRFAEQKDQRLLLRAFADLNCPAKLQFAGDGPSRASVVSEVSQLGLMDRVEFLGQRFDVAGLLERAHIFALATKWEGFPLSILEAMRAGLPVIASNVGGVPEAVTDGKTGFIVEPSNVNMLHDRLQELVASPALRQKMGQEGRKRYESLFTLEPMLQKTLTVYQMAMLGIRTPNQFMLPAPRFTHSRVGFDASRG